MEIERIRTVLLVDDDEVDRESVRRMLGAEFTVLEAATADEAVRYSLEIRPDCALLDHRLPDRDGLDLVEQLSTRGIATILLTGQGSEKLAVEAMRSGAVDYLVKERLDAGEIRRAVDHAIEVGALRRRVRDQQASLEAHEELLSQVLAALPVGVCVLDAGGTVRYLNEGAREILGPQAVDGRPVREVLDPSGLYVRGTDEPYPLSKLPLFQALAGRRSTVDDLEVDAGRSTRTLVQMSGTPIADEDGEVLQAVATLQDITHQHRLQTQIRQAQRMESVGQLAGGLAHDFNNMLTIILSCSSLALEGVPKGHGLRPDLEQIVQTTKRAERLTKQLLAFSRRQRVIPEVLDINQVFTEIETLIRRAVGETIDVQIRLQHEVWPIRMDPGALEQVVVNLAVNAKDAMPTGGTLRISTDGITADQDYGAARRVAVQAGEYVRVVVEDDGTGIDPRDIERIFEPFFTTKGAASGTGLGLATCYGLVKQAGGFIWVESELGVGTRFEILLPRVNERVRVQEKRRAKARLLGRETILVAEDDLKVRGLTERILRRFGYRVLTAADGQEALSMADGFAEDIDLLLTDVLMPKMNGRELAERFRERRPNTRILYMSGWAANILSRHGVTDVLHFVEKPFTPEALGEKVRNALDNVG